MKHYLISLPLGDAACAHCYLMTSDPGRLEGAADRLLREIENRLGPVRVPILMSTPLTPKGVRTVVKALQGMNPEADRLRAEATDFHVSMWVMASDDPRYDRLMALH